MNYMKKKKHQEPTLHELAIRLCEGGTVYFEGHFLKAVKVPSGFSCCDECDLDSICHDTISSLCCECDNYVGEYHLLKLINGKRL